MLWKSKKGCRLHVSHYVYLRRKSCHSWGVYGLFWLEAKSTILMKPDKILSVGRELLSVTGRPFPQSMTLWQSLFLTVPSSSQLVPVSQGLWGVGRGVCSADPEGLEDWLPHCLTQSLYWWKAFPGRKRSPGGFQANIWKIIVALFCKDMWR